MKLSHLILTASIAITAQSHAQSNISATNKFSWGENTGWMNWRDAGSPAASQGSIIAGSFMSGNIWCENIGYVNLGDGAPSNGASYSNLAGTDFGVNIRRDNLLGGLAWGENIGWINFGPFTTLPGNQQARFDAAAARLRGFAWGENTGWINLDDSTHFVAIACPADFNQDGIVDFFDYLDFVDAFSRNLLAADFNADAVIDFFDYLDFVDAFSTGC